MKVFEPNIPEERYNFEYPESMRIILNHLDQNGKLNVDPHIIPDDDLLKEFVNYIRNIDIEDAKNMDYYGTIHEKGYHDDFYEALYDDVDF